MQNGSRFYESTWERNNMNRDDIIRMAQEAGIVVTGEAVWKLCEIVAAAEREACAEMVEGMDVQHPKYIAAAIRARGER
jgi:hypothetical protein